MDRLRSIEIFIQVARGLSFSSAAQRLGIAKSNVTRHVGWLEKSLGVQLLARTTKSVRLTEAGLSLFENGQNLLEMVERIERDLLLSTNELKGTLRVGTPPSFGTHHLVPVITAFADAHPDIDVALYLDDGGADLVAEGLDVTIRIEQGLKDTSQIAHRLAVVPQVLLASDAYLERCGIPRSIPELAHHDCMVHSLKSPTNVWSFTGPDGNMSVRVKGTIRANFGEPLLQAALLGHGISMHPRYMADQFLQEGRLRILLEDYEPTSLDVYAVFPGRKNMPARARAFLDFLKAGFENAQWAAKPAQERGASAAGDKDNGRLRQDKS